MNKESLGQNQKSEILTNRDLEWSKENATEVILDHATSLRNLHFILLDGILPGECIPGLEYGTSDRGYGTVDVHFYTKQKFEDILNNIIKGGKFGTSQYGDLRFFARTIDFKLKEIRSNTPVVARSHNKWRVEGKPENISPSDFLLIIHEGEDIRLKRINDQLYNRKTLFHSDTRVDFNRGWNIRSFVSILATRFPEIKIYSKALIEIDNLLSEYITLIANNKITIREAEQYVDHLFSTKGNLVSGFNLSSPNPHTKKPYLYNEYNHIEDPRIIPFIENSIQSSSGIEKSRDIIESVVTGKYPMPYFDQTMIDAFANMGYTCNTYGEFLMQALERFGLKNILAVS